MKIVDVENIINITILNYIPCLLQNKFLILKNVIFYINDNFNKV